MKHIKKYKIFESKNLTKRNIENFISQNFEFTSEDIKSWVQDILDEYPELDFEVCRLVNDRDINVYFIGKQGSVTKEEYPINPDSINFVKERLLDYDCRIVPYFSYLKGDVYYSSRKDFIAFQISKI